ncbi:MAG: YbaK/EbsC family protein [Gammaproteobacteria bacterium]|nr:YbaK/EbsC family protein [Gammaproteobacteria bacterium]MDH3434324.1 YbaK/EbsC family protein [Gammaproteobacteria bacterium]
MPAQKLREFLDEHGIEYVTITHSPAYTTQRTAELTHIPGKELAKTVIVKLDDEFAMAVLPASFRIDLDYLKRGVEADVVEIASESEFKNLFPDCEVGAMPPFGNLYDMDVYVAEKLAEDEEIAFNAGSHTELIRMAYQDFEKLVSPNVIRIT